MSFEIQLKIILLLINVLNTIPLAGNDKLINEIFTILNFELDSAYIDSINQNTLYVADVDGDGLLDDRGQYINGKQIAPKDPNPNFYNGLKGIWQTQIELEKLGDIPNYLGDFYNYNIELNSLNQKSNINFDINEEGIEKIIESEFTTVLGSNLLMFRLDNLNVALHSQSPKDIYDYMMSKLKKELDTTEYIKLAFILEKLNLDNSFETWQKKYGYNKLYDEIFKVATNGNMRNLQLYFNDEKNNEYVLWIWRGDYLALGAGAEIGLYIKNNSLSESNIEHWDAVDFEIPMTLNLYNYTSAENIDSIFNWKPDNTQWWITGFNPNYEEVDVNKQVLLGSLDFSNHKDMYNSLKENYQNNSSINKFVIFDDETTMVWINWYEE